MPYDPFKHMFSLSMKFVHPFEHFLHSSTFFSKFQINLASFPLHYSVPSSSFQPLHYGQEQHDVPAVIIHILTSSGVSEQASKRVSGWPSTY